MKYFVTIGGKGHEVNIDGDAVTLDGTTMRAHIEDLQGTPITIVTIGNEVHRVVARRGDEKGRYTLSVGGHRVAAEALDDRSHTIRKLTGASAKTAGPAHLRAPMPGLIVRINVAEGDVVRAGQGLVVMEAMKMENELRANSAGKVKRIAVKAGGAVEKGALLLEMEEQ
jgi:pyruvate carboxylase subunit B